MQYKERVILRRKEIQEKKAEEELLKSKKKKEAKDAKSNEIDFRLCGHKSIERSEKLAEMMNFFIEYEDDLKDFVSKKNEVAKQSNDSNEEI